MSEIQRTKEKAARGGRHGYDEMGILLRDPTKIKHTMAYIEETGRVL